ncbi:hypothetical protein RWX45_03995, partial [Actinomyces sp. MRS3W]|nr:hypothetical protein [Actinomyces sp. MRS3W]
VQTAPVPRAPRPAPRPVRPPRPRRPGPGRRLSLVIAGIICCAVAAVILAWSTGHLGQLAGVLAVVGTITALLGLGVTIAALRGRRGGWMTGLGWLAVMVAVPVLIIGTNVPNGALRATEFARNVSSHSVTLTWDDLESRFAAVNGDVDTSVDLGDYAVGDVILDLTDMPVGEEPTVRAHLSLGIGTVTIHTSTEQNLGIDSTVGLGETIGDFKDAWLVDGRSLGDGGYWQEDRYTVDGTSVNNYSVAQWRSGEMISFLSPAAQDAGTAMQLSIEVGTGSVRIAEEPGEITWYGIQRNGAWIVWSWVDEHGGTHDELPVPGMTHEAIDTDTASVCAAAAQAADEASDNTDDTDEDEYEDSTDSYWDGSWYDMPELTGAGREAWDNCVNEALESGSAAGASADASASPTEAATAAPSAAPSGTATTSGAPEPTAAPTN